MPPFWWLHQWRRWLSFAATKAVSTCPTSTKEHHEVPALLLFRSPKLWSAIPKLIRTMKQNNRDIISTPRITDIQNIDKKLVCACSFLVLSHNGKWVSLLCDMVSRHVYPLERYNVSLFDTEHTTEWATFPNPAYEIIHSNTWTNYTAYSSNPFL